jgi:hypothetical protein
MTSRVLWMLPLLGSLACGKESDPPFRMNLQAHGDDTASEPFSGQLAVAWFAGDELTIDKETARQLEAGTAAIELPDEPPRGVPNYADWDRNALELRLGVLAAVGVETDETVELWSEEPVESGFESDEGSTKFETWCESDADFCVYFGCDDIHDQCYRETYDCKGFDEEDCTLTSTQGEAYHKNRWGALGGVAEEYLVAHARSEASAEQLAGMGLYVGPLEPGYHLIRGHRLTGKELEASKACWERAESLANAYVDGKPTDIDIGAVMERNDELGGGGDTFTYWGIVAAIATLGLQCPVHHVRWELAQASEARIDVRLSREAKPLFGFVHPQLDWSMYEEVIR